MIELDVPVHVRAREPSAGDPAMPAVVVVRPEERTEAAEVIVLLPDGLGLRDHVVDVARRLARRGYVVLVPDVFFRSGRLRSFTLAELDDAVAAMRAVTEDDVALVVDRLRAVVTEEFAGERPKRLSTLGFCFGGRLSLVVAGMLTDDVAAVGMFYPNGLLETPDGWSRPPISFADRLRCPVLGFFGGADRHIPEEEAAAVDEYLADKGIDADLYLYPGRGHAFFDEGHPNFDAASSQDAWCRLVALLGGER